MTWDEKKNGLGHCGIDCGCGRATGHNASCFATLHMRCGLSTRRRSLSGLSLAAAAILHYYIGAWHTKAIFNGTLTNVLVSAFNAHYLFFIEIVKRVKSFLRFHCLDFVVT